MATLYLIRHGQASFMSENYDVLSELGRQQSAVLGDYLSAKEFKFDYTLRGTLQRHIDTYQTAKQHYEEKGNNVMPVAEALEAFNEHQAAEIHYRHLPTILEEASHRPLKAALQEKGKDDPEVKRALLKLFLRSTIHWAKGELNMEGFETFTRFKARVTEGFHHLKDDLMPKHKSVAIFSSGGTIGMLLGLVLELKDEKVMELNWQIRNTSITELSFGNGKFYLRGFNYCPHLEQKPELLTYV